MILTNLYLASSKNTDTAPARVTAGTLAASSPPLVHDGVGVTPSMPAPITVGTPVASTPASVHDGWV
jgi:hypothetical protein